MDRQTVDRQTVDRIWLAECNYIHCDSPSEEQGHVPMATAAWHVWEMKGRHDYGWNLVWPLGANPQKEISYHCPGDLVGLHQM